MSGDSLRAAPAPRFAVRDNAAVNALWLGIQFQDAAILAIIVPAILLQLDRQHGTNVHTDVLALYATLAAIAATFVPMVAGALSDRARRRGGDRRRETAIALAVDVLALGAMAISHTIGLLGLEVVAASIAIAAASTIYQALLPDVVPKSAWGAAAGMRGAMTLLGTVLGLAAAARLTPHVALLVMALFIVLSATSLLAIRHERRDEPVRSHAVVRDWHDLGITLVARGWIVLGMTLLQTYILYFFSDVLRVRDASLGTGLVAGAALVGAIGSSITTGVLSDRVDRRYVVALSGIPMTLAALGFALAPQANLIFLYAALFGLGYGGVFSVGWALALDAIPELGDAARDLGIWGTLSNMPGIAAPALGAWIIAHGATPRDGYRALFALAGGCFFVGSLIVLRVGRNPVASIWSALFVALTCVFRQPYLRLFRLRVRSWGRLPFRRGPTVLIANHQHEDESETVMQRTFLQGPWRAPILTASTRRMYEPGFFAWRMPWLAPFARELNAGGMFYALGMLPIENQLNAQPLRSLARAVRAAHGNLPVNAVFRDAALALLPPGAATLDDVLAPRNFNAGERAVKIAYLHEPYRRETLERIRASIDEDVARIVDVTRRGATFFVTPEGNYSTDGRMRPLRGIVDHLLAVADPWLLAISFDPFRGRRLSFMYRIVRPARRDAIDTSLAAARPFTTSGLLARWLLAVDLPFEAEEARAGVARALAALPPGAFVDPELRRDPARVVDEALATMARRGWLIAEGARWRLADVRVDPRFRGVADIVAYQATFANETLAALERLAAAA
ncbi:MAG TPA: MFS transporter [Candidatus Sulfotelmatobacter sp.]|nr:MFS transporter [Candidatus Sulfotelmatobacter sp.]